MDTTWGWPMSTRTDKENALSRYVRLARRPVGTPTPEDFAFVEADLPDVTPGTALVENLYVSVDPYMRGLMNQAWTLGAPGEGRSIGRVIESNDRRLAVGDTVFHWRGWRTHALVEPEQVRVLSPAQGVPLSAYLSILGGTGRTAYVGLTRICQLQKGESVFISAAAGGVGSAGGQIAKALGAGRLIGSAGSAAKVRHLIDDLGLDAAFNYHDGPVAELLAKAAPDGIDVALENVGGDHLEAAISVMRDHGRIACCGAISGYNSTEPAAGPKNAREIDRKGLKVENFSVRDYQSVQDEMEQFLVPHIQSGRITPDENIVEGFDQIVDAFLGLFSGQNIGKTIVRV